MHPKGFHTVRAKGKIYYYAWRGGPRLMTNPDHPGFDAEYSAALSTRDKGSGAGKRKRALPTSERSLRTVEGLAIAALNGAKQRSRLKGLPFNISLPYLLNRMKDNRWRCELSDIEFSPRYDPRGDFSHNPYGVSIDRINPQNGYVEGNIRVVLTAVNFAINQWGLDAYLRIADAMICKHLGHNRPVLKYRSVRSEAS